jgi:hypothetical protein
LKQLVDHITKGQSLCHEHGDEDDEDEISEIQMDLSGDKGDSERVLFFNQ